MGHALLVQRFDQQLLQRFVFHGLDQHMGVNGVAELHGVEAVVQPFGGAMLAHRVHHALCGGRIAEFPQQRGGKRFGLVVGSDAVGAQVHLHQVAMFERGQCLVESAFGDPAPRTHKVGPDLDHQRFCRNIHGVTFIKGRCGAIGVPHR